MVSVTAGKSAAGELGGGGALSSASSASSSVTDEALFSGFSSLLLCFGKFGS